MPVTQGDLLDLVREIRTAALAEGGELVCVLEEVSGFAGKAQPGSAMFRFGEHFGFIKGLIQALEVRLVLVRPQVWQRGFGLGTASACARSRPRRPSPEPGRRACATGWPIAASLRFPTSK